MNFHKLSLWRSHRASWLILGISFVAMVARFAYLLQIEHNVDHAYSVGQALTTLATGAMPLVGQATSLQFPNGALLGYLYLPLLAFLPSVLILYVVVIGLNSLAVYLTYRTTRLLYSTQAGLWAGALMAVNPWLIEYSRSTWTHAFMPFLLSLSAFLMWRIVLGRSPHATRDTIVLALSVTAVTQFALLGYFILPHVALIALRYWRRFPRRAVAVSLGIFIALNGLFAIGLLQSLDAVSQRAERMLEQGVSEGARLRVEPFLHTARLVSGAQYELNRGRDAPIQDVALRNPLSEASSSAVAFLLVLGLGLALMDMRQPRRRDGAFMVLVWLALPALTMAYNSTLIHPFYLMMGLPAGYVLTGRALDWLVYRGGRVALMLVVVGVALHGALMLVNSGRYYQETAHRPGDHALDALSLEYGLQMGEAIRQHLPEGGRVFAPVEGWIIQSFAGRYFPTSEDTRAPDFSIVPHEGGLYVSFHAGTVAPAPAFAVRVERIALRDGTTITLDRYAIGAFDEGAVTALRPVRGERWMDFIGYDWGDDADNDDDDEGATTRTLTTYWRVQQGIEQDATLAGYTFAPFVHLFNAQGERLRVVDGLGVVGTSWRAGDVHVHRMVFEADADVTGFHVGQYDGVRGEGLIFIEADGTYTPTIAIEKP